MADMSTSNTYGITRENLLKTLPIVLRGDSSTQALADAVAQLLEQRVQETDLPRIYSRIDELDEAMLDILAKDLKVDWYDYDYPLEVKRTLIRESVLTHKRLGTVYAVRSVLESMYPGARLEEWYTYGGTPGCFRLTIDVMAAGEGVTVIFSPAEIDRRLGTVKRWSAHLESVNYQAETEGELLVGACAAMSQLLEVWPELATMLEVTGGTCTGGGTETRQSMEVWPELVKGLEITAKAQALAGTVTRQAVEVWPEQPELVEATAEVNTDGATAMRRVVEIYPEGGG